MNHLTLPRFWQHYNDLPLDIQALADKNFRLLKDDPHHPSLHYRALGREKPEGIVWFWIGSHADYDKLLG